jgi:hypothetical protein
MPNKIRLTSFAVLISFIITVYYFYHQGVHLSLEYPQNTYLFNPMDRMSGIMEKTFPRTHVYSDLYAVWWQTRATNPYPLGNPDYPSNYLPFAHFLLKPWSMLSYDNALTVFFIITSLILAAFAHVFLRTKDRYENVQNLIIFTFILYPSQMIFDRGNIESIVFLFTWLFVWFLSKNKNSLASSFLALAAGMKLFPAIFGVILLQKKEYKAAAVSAVTFLIVTGISLMTFEGSISATIYSMLDAIKEYNVTTTTNKMTITHNSSLSALFYVLYYAVQTHFPNQIQFMNFLSYLRDHAYSWISIVMIGWSVISILLKPSMKLWESMTLLTLLTLLLPHSSYDYRLIYLLIPFALLANDETENGNWGMLFTVLFILLFIPKGMFLLRRDINIGSFLNPVLMTFGIFCLLWKNSLFTSLSSVLSRNQKLNSG